jgi:hypothetical protein
MVAKRGPAVYLFLTATQKKRCPPTENTCRPNTFCAILSYSVYVICLHVYYFIAVRIQFLIALKETIRFLKFVQTCTILKMFQTFHILTGAQVFGRWIFQKISATWEIKAFVTNIYVREGCHLISNSPCHEDVIGRMYRSTHSYPRHVSGQLQAPTASFPSKVPIPIQPVLTRWTLKISVSA